MNAPHLTSLKAVALLGVAALVLTGCNNLTFPQRNSPANIYKEYRPEAQESAAVIGVGEPISQRQAAANATISLSGQYPLETVLQRMAGTYNLAVRWGNGVRKNSRAPLVMNSLSFDEARNYIEDVYNVQIIKEGERRLLVLPSASEPRLTEFAPGNNVTLSQALRGLAEQCNYNLIVNENRHNLNRLRVSTRLRDITCHDAFEALLNPQGLSLVDAGDYVTVGGLPQRQWTVNLFEPVRDEEVSVNYSSDFTVGAEGEESSGSTGMSAGGSSKVSIRYERNLWEDLQADLEALLNNSCVTPLNEAVDEALLAGSPLAADPLLPPPSAEGAMADPAVMATATGAGATAASTASLEPTADEAERCGYVRVNTAVGLVQMRAPRTVLEEANDIIRRTENIANRRLLLEARVLAVSRDRGFEQRGGVLAANDNPDSTSFSIGAPGSIAAGLGRILGNFGEADTLRLGGFSIANRNLDAVIGLLESYSTTYNLMQPVMELMDRQRATLIDGTNQKYFIVQSTTTTGTATSTSTDVQERTQFLGLQFSASAQISEDPSEPHTVSLQIPITSQVGEVPIPTGVSGTTAGVVPIANTRLIDQKVRIRDGEIKAIGGLTMTMATDRESGMPVLRDIPALGKLANDETTEYRQVEFVILLQVRRLN